MLHQLATTKFCYVTMFEVVLQQFVARIHHKISARTNTRKHFPHLVLGMRSRDPQHGLVVHERDWFVSRVRTIKRYVSFDDVTAHVPLRFRDRVYSVEQHIAETANEILHHCTPVFVWGFSAASNVVLEVKQ